MSKKDILKKGFNNLIQPTEAKVEKPVKELGKPKKETAVTQTLKRPNAQKYKRSKEAKYKELKKCTLYLPAELMDSLAIMKIKTKKDLSELTGEALRDYLINNKFLNV